MTLFSSHCLISFRLSRGWELLNQRLTENMHIGNMSLFLRLYEGSTTNFVVSHWLF